MQESPWTPYDSFGARLALVRQECGWNISEAARECGLGEANWRNWEDGSSPRDFMATCHAIAERSGCDLMWLADGGALRTGSGQALAA